MAAISAPGTAMAELSTRPAGAPGTATGAYLQCVPYAREISGIGIYGDAHTWWEQASGRYARGHTPRVGAVMAFKPYRNMVLGHVAAVSRILDARTVLLKHSNWSEIGGRRGQIEDNVRAVDVSPNNDWSEVRVWYGTTQTLGTTHWPVHGFIYNEKPGTPASAFRYAFNNAPAQPAARVQASAQATRVAAAPQRDTFAAELALDRMGGDVQFARAFADLR